ncbi:MAG: hypothetical protein KDD33_05035 [Bdellovibrionales bacterium]|nr:hypothetical protein [Bdellovibrionales bacterium]
MKQNQWIIFTTTLVILGTLLSQHTARKNREQRQRVQIEQAVKKSLEQNLEVIKNKRPAKDSTKESNGETTNSFFENTKTAIALSNKVLPSLEEQQKLRAYLSDEAMMEEAIDYLGTPPDADLKSNEARRMDLVLLLTRALEWRSNPKKDAIQQRVAEFILQDNLAEFDDNQIRLSFAADKTELFTNLKDVDFQAGLEIEKQNQSDFNAKLFRFANNFYGLNRKKEK